VIDPTGRLLVLNEYQLEGWLGDGKVRVPRASLGRFCTKQLLVERDRGVEVADIESELYSGNGVS
jgi:hypothetical protein